MLFATDLTLEPSCLTNLIAPFSYLYHFSLFILRWYICMSVPLKFFLEEGTCQILTKTCLIFCCLYALCFRLGRVTMSPQTRPHPPAPFPQTVSWGCPLVTFLILPRRFWSSSEKEESKESPKSIRKSSCVLDPHISESAHRATAWLLFVGWAGVFLIITRKHTEGRESFVSNLPNKIL